MRIAKLIFFFILIVGNIVLLFNLGTIFGNKQYPAQQLSETDRVGIFTELLKDTIDSDEFYRSDEAKKIVDKYNELGKKAQEALRLAEDAVIRANNAARRAEAAAQRAENAKTFRDAITAAEKASGALSIVEDIARQFPSEAVDKAKIRAEAAVIRAEEAVQTKKKDADTVKEKVAAEVGGSKNAEVGGSKNKVDESVVATAEDVAAKATEDAFKKNKEQKAQTVDQIKAEILELVKKKDFNACMKHPGWNKLGQTDKNTVDYLLRTNQYAADKVYYDGKVAKKYSKAQVKIIMKYINGLNFEDFKTWADLEAAKNEIRRIRTETER